MRVNEFKREIREFSPYEFEKFVSTVWEQNGWETQVTDDTRDRGIDIVATQDSHTKEVIQVKRYAEGNKVGSQEVRNYATLYQQEDADSVAIVTASSFTDPGRELAQDLEVRAIDGTRLYELSEGDASLDQNNIKSDSITGSSIDKETPPGGFREAFSQTGHILQDLADLMGQINDLAQFDRVEYRFAMTGDRTALDQSVRAHDQWLDVIEGCFKFAEKFRELPEDSFPSDLWSLLEIQISHLESLGEEIAQGLKYKEKLVNSRLENTPIEPGERQKISVLIDSKKESIRPSQPQNIDQIMEKQEYRMGNVTQIIRELGELSQERKEIVERYT